MSILKFDMKLEKFYSIHYLLIQYILLYLVLHRLDKLTSGLLALAKNQHVAFKFHDDMQKIKIEKRYIARVMGKFEEQEIVVDKAIYCASPRLSKYDYCKDEQEEKEKEAKASKTIFNRLWYDEISHTSLVECNLSIYFLIKKGLNR